MKKIFIILVLCILGFESFLYAKTSKQTLLRDGIVLKTVVGKLIASDSNDKKWFFELNSPVTNYDPVIKTGEKIELLPSSSLEMMIDSTKTHLPATYLLWNAKITKYKGKNYIFPSMFIPVHPLSEIQASEKKDSENSSPEETGTQSPDSTDSNDILSLPPEIMEQFKKAEDATSKTGQRIPDSNFVTIDNVKEELERKRQLNSDTVILDEYAVFVRDNKDGFKFNLDTIGRNIDSTSLRLLPCEVLEQTETMQISSPETLRFKISGIVTKYQGDKYLLLYKATQIYSYGNLGK